MEWQTLFLFDIIEENGEYWQVLERRRDRRVNTSNGRQDQVIYLNTRCMVCLYLQ